MEIGFIWQLINITIGRKNLISYRKFLEFEEGKKGKTAQFWRCKGQQAIPLFKKRLDLEWTLPIEIFASLHLDKVYIFLITFKPCSFFFLAVIPSPILRRNNSLPADMPSASSPSPQGVQGPLLSPNQYGSIDPVHDLPPELLQAGWRKFWSKRENRPYFFNKVTNESLWEMPRLGHVSAVQMLGNSLTFVLSYWIVLCSMCVVFSAFVWGSILSGKSKVEMKNGVII